MFSFNLRLNFRGINNYLFTIYRDIKGEQEISRDFFLPRPSETFLIILHHELASDARLPKKVEEGRGKKKDMEISCSVLISQ